MDELEKYGGKEIDLRKENQDNLKKYSVRLTGDEMDLLYELGCYLKDPKRNPSKSSNVYKATFEAVRKLPKVPRNMNYYYLQDPNFLVDEETEDKKLGKSSSRKRSTTYCLAFSCPSMSACSFCKISDAIGYDFTDFYSCNPFFIAHPFRSYMLLSNTFKHFHVFTMCNYYLRFVFS